jgi:2Fe-2S ferredoxin
MPKLIVRDRTGEERILEVTIGLSVMECIREAGIDELLALCGGCCSCATCHVFVHPDWTETVGPAEGDEDDLLDSSSSKMPASRLSCQLQVTADLDGLHVTIAPED